MKILIIIYILSVIIIATLFFKDGKDSVNGTKWYEYSIAFCLAPLLVIPAIVISIKDRNNTEPKPQLTSEETEQIKKRAEERRKTPWEEYNLAKEKYDNLFDTSFIDVVRKLYQTAKNKDYDNILNCLDKLSLPKDLSFEIDDRFNTEAAGDFSRVYVRLENEEKKIRYSST